MAEIEIIIGSNVNNPLYHFYNSKNHIVTISGVSSSSMVGNELSIDKLSFTVDLGTYRDTLYSPVNYDAYQDTNDLLYAVVGDPLEASDRIRALAYATPIRIYVDGNLFGKFFSDSVKRKTATRFTISASSSIQILQDASDHMGGLYNGAYLIDVLVSIIGGTPGTQSGGYIPVTGGIVNYYVSTAVSNIRVYGWLPKDTPRNNLHQILFAHGINILKGNDGDIVLDYLTSVTATNVSDDRLFIGGSVTYTPPATRIELTEHTYVSLATDETVVLMNNQNGGVPSDETLVTFGDGPVHSLSAEGELTILESGVNYAIVRGVGILKGKKYHHTETVIETEIENSNTEKTVKSNNCTLISPLNGEAVLDRLISYYLSARQIKADLSVQTERTGSMIRFHNVFGEMETAFIAKMNYRLTSFVRATCDLVADYDPSNVGNEYTNVVLISSSGTWTVPSGVTRIMVVCIGGGDGGGCGGDGGFAYGDGPFIPNKNGEINVSLIQGTTYAEFAGENIYAGAGGAPGIPGKGGRIYKQALSVTPGQSFSISIGTGGAGAPIGSATGSSGGNTIFGSISSASGYSSGSGFTDLLTGNTYADTGESGIYGSAGDGPDGAATDIIVNGSTYTHGSRGATLSDSDTDVNISVSASGSYEIYGGWGGGAAYKASGGNGRSGDGYIDVQTIYSPRIEALGVVLQEEISDAISIVQVAIAAGGNGANAQAPPNATIYGKGGTSGNGGGGVGSFGAPAVGRASVKAKIAIATITIAYGNADKVDSGPFGTPGKGSAGGNGASGCVLVYY